MEALAAIGLVSNVLGFIETSAKLCALIKEYSAISRAPDEVVTISKRLQLTLSIIKELDGSGRAKLDHETLALKICTDEAEDLRQFLETLCITSQETPNTSRRFKWFSSKQRTVEKGWKAFKTLRGKEKLEKLQMSLDRILSLVVAQQQSRIEYVVPHIQRQEQLMSCRATTLDLSVKTSYLVQNSKSMIKELNELSLSSRPTVDNKISKRRNTFKFCDRTAAPLFPT